MMEEESWVCVDESFSSDEHFSDSDKVDSETEAELYSLIHFEGNLSSLNRQSSAANNDTESDGTFLLSNKMKYVVSTEKNEYNGETKFSGNSNNILQNGINDLNRIENFDKTVSDNSLLKTLHEKEEIFSTDYKVPTNFVNISNSNQLAVTQSSSDSNKRKFDHSVPNYSSPPKKAATDSGRSIISTDLDSSGNEDIQTNVCEEKDDDIIFISSDSETDHSPTKKRISPHQNISMPNIKIGENRKELWYVNQEDISRARNIKSRRYHDKVDVTCSNCNGKGHHSRTCPLPRSVKCFICGGEHISSACRNRICGNCYGTGHDRRSCRMFQVRFCGLCRMRGHIKECCPDLWRRYHLTTQPGQIVPDNKVNQNSFIFCCKCGRPGHFGAICNFEQKGYQNCFPTWPNVLTYDEPSSLPVKTSNTPGNKNREKKDLVIKRKKMVLNEAQILARKEKIKRRRQEKKQLKRRELLKSNEIHKVLKEKDFPRTPKNNSAIDLRTKINNSAINVSSSRTPKNNSAINPSSPRTPKNNSAINLSSLQFQKNNPAINLSSPRTKINNSAANLFSPRLKKNNSTINPFSPRTDDSVLDDAVIILPSPPKTKKTISVVDLTSPKTRKGDSAFNDPSDLPESVRLVMLAEAKRKEKNRRRRIKRRQNRLREREQSQNMNT